MLTKATTDTDEYNPTTPLPTSEHERFAMLRAVGVNGAEAYRLAGFEGKSSTGQYQMGRRLRDNPRIRARIEYLRQHPDTTQSETLKMLSYAARWPDTPMPLKVSALREVASIKGWHHHKSSTPASDSASSDAEISRRLSAAAQAKLNPKGGEGGKL